MKNRNGFRRNQPWPIVKPSRNFLVVSTVNVPQLWNCSLYRTVPWTPVSVTKSRQMRGAFLIRFLDAKGDCLDSGVW